MNSFAVVQAGPVYKSFHIPFDRITEICHFKKLGILLLTLIKPGFYF